MYINYWKFGMSLYNRFFQPETLLRCYRLDYRSAYDEELVWALVQQHGGHISIRQDCIDFWIHRDWEVVLLLAFPDLVRRPDLDYL